MNTNTQYFLRKNTLLQLLLMATIIQISSCVAIFVPNKQSINFNTKDNKTKIYVDNEEVGSGKNFFAKIKKTGPKQVIIKTEGYKDKYAVLLPQRRVNSYIPLHLLDLPFIYPVVILDPYIRDKTFRYSPLNSFSSAEKYNTKSNNEKYIDFDGVGLKVKNSEKDINTYYIKHDDDLMGRMKEAEEKRAIEIAKKEQKQLAKKKPEKKLLDKESKEVTYENTKLANNIFSTLYKNKYIDTVNKVFLDNSNLVGLEGVITKYAVFLVKAKGLSSNTASVSYATYSYAKAKIDIMWYIKNTYNEIIDSIEDKSYSGEFGHSFVEAKGLEPAYADAAEVSLQKLMNNPKFIKYLQLDTNYNSSDPVLSITKPTQLVVDANDATNASVIIKRKDKGHGSGFAISNDGYILTNYHVIADEFGNKTADIKVVLANGEETSVKVVRVNKMRDIALLKVDVKFEKAFYLSKEKTYKKFMDVYAVGTPKSIELGQSVSLGILSNERKTNNSSLLQLNMSVNSGNSGGPLFDKTGVLHGVVTSKLIGFSTEGVAFAIPSFSIPNYLNLEIK